jgi:hypothetical protein
MSSTFSLESAPDTASGVDPQAPPTAGDPSIDPADRRSTWPALYRRSAAAVGSATEWMFGLSSVMIGLAVLASVPVLQLLSLGYLLESSGRVARTGRLRAGFVGIRPAARIGSIALGTWLVLWPARAVAGLWYSSWLLNGPAWPTRAWWLAMVAVSCLTIALVLWAWYRGGRLRHFLWPAPGRLMRRLSERGAYGEARDHFWQFVARLHLPKLFWLGLRGAIGAMVWLALPVTLLMLASRLAVPAGLFSGLIGATALATILLYLPFLQARFAASDRWADLFDIRAVRRGHAQAPIAFWVALVATLALALPLYLLKAELVPREAVWLPSLIFVIFIWPARWLTGWAVARAERRETPRHFVFRWLSRLAMVPVALIYVLVVYFTQYVSWYGGLSLYEQHAFLLPVPFLGL